MSKIANYFLLTILGLDEKSLRILRVFWPLYRATSVRT